jgi:predicted nucleic acid-binding protein
MKMINSGFLEIQDPFSSNQRFVLDVMNKYNDVPCAFADANLLAMFENDKNSVIISTDSDFLIYRDSQGKKLNLISPYLK